MSCKRVKVKSRKPGILILLEGEGDHVKAADNTTQKNKVQVIRLIIMHSVAECDKQKIYIKTVYRYRTGRLY